MNSRASDDEILRALAAVRDARRGLEDSLRKTQPLMTPATIELIEIGLQLGGSIVLEWLMGAMVAGSLPISNRRYVAGLLRKFSDEYGDNALTKRIFPAPTKAGPAEDGETQGQE